MRKGFTLLEMMIVLGIISILAALGVVNATKIMPSWRTKATAAKFADHVREARTLAILHDREARVEITDFDASPEADGDNFGAYTVAIGNQNANSTFWDVLPFEDTLLTDDGQGEGTHDFGKNSKNRQRSVALVQPSVDTVTFDPRGIVTNGAGDFTHSDGGAIVFTFANKQDANDKWDVLVFRGGMIRLEAHKGRKYDSHEGGTATQSTN